MDRSVWSDPAVVVASRAFTCLRLATYESAEEAKVLEWVFLGRQGTLENTVFALVSPDGKTKLSRGGRSPDMVFRGNAELVTAMNEVAGRYPPVQVPAADRGLPRLATARLGLNVAACDGQLLVVVVGEPGDARVALERRVAGLAWSDELVGRAQYALATRGELATVTGLELDAGVLVVEPDAFGSGGKVVAQLAGDRSDAELSRAISVAVVAHTAVGKDTRAHIGEGRRAGVHWDTAIPVTDPHVPGDRAPPGR